jgi:hypothetical protein
MTPRIISAMLFQGLPLLVVSVSFCQYFFPVRSTFVNVCVIGNITHFLAQPHPEAADLFVVVDRMDRNETQAFINLSETKSAMVAFSFESSNSTFLSVSLPNGTVASRKVTGLEKRIAPIRLFLRDLLVIDSKFGRIGFIVAREMFQSEFFTARDVDFLVTFGGYRSDEKNKLARRTARMVSQITGAGRLHAGHHYQTFAVGSDGVFQFQDEKDVSTKTASKAYRVKVSENVWHFVGIRVLLCGYVVTVAFLVAIGLNLVSMKAATNFLLLLRELVCRGQDM